MSSAIPTAIDRLLVLWRTAKPAVMFIDATTLSGDEGRTADDNIARRVFVGGGPEGGEEIPFDREWAGLGAMQVHEVFDIPCHLECGSGDEDTTVLRDAGFDLLDDLSAALAGDLDLGLINMTAAVLGRGALAPVQHKQGATVGIRFLVHCDTTIS